VLEGKSSIPTHKRVKKLLKGSFTSTFVVIGAVVLVVLAVTVVRLFLQIPMQRIHFSSMLPYNIQFLVLAIFIHIPFSIIRVFQSFIFHVAAVFQYYSLTEKKDSEYILKKVEDLNAD